jgi:hypothetical protein
MKNEDAIKFSPGDRLFVLNKYDKHCGYCGCELDLRSMQVDHIIPKCNGGTNQVENLMPSCRRCNHYKRGGGVEYLRYLLLSMKSKLERIYIFRVAEKYGMVMWNDWDGKFYFEKYKCR